MNQILNSFDNRDLAVAFWLLVIIVLAASNSSIRVQLASVVQALFARSIVVVLLLLSGYLGSIAYLLSLIDIWVISQLKITVLWLVTVGFMGLFAIQEMSLGHDHFMQYLRSNFKITILLEFFVNLYRMPLPVELLFVPISIFLGLTIAFADTKAELGQIKGFLNGIAVFIGATLAAYALWKTIKEFDSIANLDTMRSFTLPIIFSIVLLPFLWIVSIFVAYQSVFVRLQFAVKNKSLHPYIKRSLFIKFRSSIKHLNPWLQAAWSHKIETKEDVDESIEALLDGACRV